MVELIWREFGQAQVDLFASWEMSQCPLWFSLTHPAPLGLDAMVQMWPRLRLYAFPLIALLPGVLERVHRARVLLLSLPTVAGQSMVPRYNIPSRRASSGAPRQEGPSVPSGGLEISPPTRTVETVGLVSEGAQLTDSGFSTEVVETILHSRAPSTRKLYALKWRVFTSWCSDHQLDTVNCSVGTVLEFLLERFTAGLTPSTLKVYAVAICAYHIPLCGISLGKTSWYLIFLRGTWGSVLLLSECGPGKAQFALPNTGIRCLYPQSCPVAEKLTVVHMSWPPNKGRASGWSRPSCLWVSRSTSSYGCPVPLDQEYGGLQGPDIRSCSPRGLWCGRLFLTAHIRQILFLDLDSTPGS